MKYMDSSERTAWIVERARATGFDLCGVASLESGPSPKGDDPGNDVPQTFGELRHSPEWLARGYAGEMKYLHDARRADPRSVLPGARSMIAVAMNYHSRQPLSTQIPPDENGDSPRGWISRYAWGDDYHDVMLKKLRDLIAEMRDRFVEPFEARAYVDTGPIVERVAAKYAGLGWLAKNTMLINQKLGSWLFLGTILTTLELEPTLARGQAPPADLCGSCTRCLDACPTQAFPQPHVLDARRCISYLTIELRTAIPEELRASMGRATFGCDICQDVCPWNRKAPFTSFAGFQPREILAAATEFAHGSEWAEHAGEIVSTSASAPKSLVAPELAWLASLSQQEFSRSFRKSAVKRAKWRGLVRNACVALGNAKISPQSREFPRIIRLLESLAASEDTLIAEHARWALDRLPAAEPKDELQPKKEISTRLTATDSNAINQRLNCPTLKNPSDGPPDVLEANRVWDQSEITHTPARKFRKTS